ncbi:pancreatic triacylglycerol lipase-like [Condylostylus longicornis]|uniref:pancreatic triacylglycerol lipase-like n=1 Tax=Condylostylus longicornis TaxID=2530218 RepID=UPI00244D9CDA|nr:pancreatic triacylglycerol lipase-like [Condylostylus longicornis]
MLNIKYFIYIIFTLINKLNGQLEFSDNYQSLIRKADLFYLNPIPNDQPEEISISELDSPFSWKSNDIKVIIHGWTADRNHVSISPLKYAYLAKGHDAVFVADWNEAARIIYLDSRYFVKPIGIKLGKLLEKFIKKNNIAPEKIHILGHSLGAHIAGNIGDYFNGTIGRITGLDPAGPLFENFVRDGLLPNHAKFVDCIHTAIPTLGQLLQRGHADFYPNYGKISQPGCEVLDVITATSCSHLRAPLFYAESIQLPYSFASFPCSLKSILKEKCYLRKSKNVVFMGENLSKNAKGSYYLQGNNVSPYGLGMFSLAYLKFNNNSNTEINEKIPLPTSTICAITNSSNIEPYITSPLPISTKTISNISTNSISRNPTSTSSISSSSTSTNAISTTSTDERTTKEIVTKPISNEKPTQTSTSTVQTMPAVINTQITTESFAETFTEKF